GSKVFSSGKIKEVYEKYTKSSEPILFILDEAHRYRNEDTTDYKMLHQICRSNPDNKVLLLTATPFNNDPKDVFALIKLFQTPGQATIRSVDNLSLRYRDLIQKYKKLRRDMRKNIEQEYIEKETGEIALEQRRLIEPIIIRRSRLDLDYISRYKEDLHRQNISFPEIIGPELIEYDLGKLSDLYLKTLTLITKADNEGFIGARYKPTEYMNEENRKIFIKEYKDDFDDIEDIKIAQTNLAQFMRRLLVMRFESSKEAFRLTLKKMIDSNKLIESWLDKQGIVPIMKKGNLPDPKDYEQDTDNDVDSFEEELELLRDKKGFIEIKKDLLDNNFILDLHHDTKLLISIYNEWFENSEYINDDPKINALELKINKFLRENPDRKIVIFSGYKDTVNYLFLELQKRGFSRVTKYTSTESNETNKKSIKSNFDASYKEQSNEFDVLVATDALSEGFNLHRAGIIINYDIPYNPTRVIQRVGRINRINKKVFDYIYIYNFFPTAIGEEEIKLKSISTLKIKLINAVVGTDTKTLTNEEELLSFFKDEFDRANKEEEALSWDTVHRERYENALKDEKLMEVVKDLPRRSRIKRLNSKRDGVIVFGKKGDNSVFTFSGEGDSAEVISIETALPYFESNVEELSYPVDDNFIHSFDLAKRQLFAKHELPKIDGRRASAISVLKFISEQLPSSKDYCQEIISIIKDLDDISEGTLKDIAQIDTKNIENSYKILLSIIPEVYIINIRNRANKTNKEEELLLFAEELK
ncbi:MAG: helicase-related protein, partial [Patescibacteria group bacterium]